ncbi:hypothetical protein D3C81_1422330 [compost metagenome]
MVLLGFFAVEQQAALIIRRCKLRGLAMIVKCAEMALQQLSQAVIDVPGYADYCIFDRILLLHVSAQVIRCHLKQAFLQPED